MPMSSTQRRAWREVTPEQLDNQCLRIRLAQIEACRASVQKIEEQVQVFVEAKETQFHL